MNEPRRVQIDLCQPCAAKLREAFGFLGMPSKLEENEVKKLPLAERETINETFLRVLCDACLSQAGLERKPKVN